MPICGPVIVAFPARVSNAGHCSLILVLSFTLCMGGIGAKKLGSSANGEGKLVPFWRMFMLRALDSIDILAAGKGFEGFEPTLVAVI